MDIANRKKARLLGEDLLWRSAQTSTDTVRQRRLGSVAPVHQGGQATTTRQLVLTTLALLAASLYANAQAPTNLSSLPASSYEHVYRHVRHLQSADSAAAASAHPTNLSAYYKNLAGLTQPQADAMQAVSLAALAELDALDQQAQTLILQARAQGRAKLLPGQKPPGPPAQLAALQTARKAVLNKYHDNLAQALGQSAFAHLEQALIANFKVGPTVPNSGTGH